MKYMRLFLFALAAALGVMVGDSAARRARAETTAGPPPRLAEDSPNPTPQDRRPDPALTGTPAPKS